MDRGQGRGQRAERGWGPWDRRGRGLGRRDQIIVERSEFLGFDFSVLGYKFLEL